MSQLNPVKLTQIKSVLWMTSEKGVKLIATILGAVLVANYLGRSNYGTLGYIIALTGMLINVPFLGVKSYIGRDLVENISKASIILSSCLSTSLFGSIATIVIINIISFIINWDNNYLIYLSFVGSLYYSAIWAQTFEPYFIFISKTKLYSLYNLIGTIISLFLKLIGIYYGLGLEYFVWVFAAEFLPLMVFILFWVLKTKELRISLKNIDRSYTSNIVKKSIPLILSGIGVSIYMQIDQIMITNILGADSNGYYTLANRLSSSIYFIPVAICNTLVPAIARSRIKDFKFYEHRIKILFGFLFWSSLLLCIGIFIFIPLVVESLFSQEFLQTIPIARVYIWSSVFVFIAVGQDKWLIQERKYTQLMERALAGAAINVLLNLIMIPRFGLNGAAYATLISYSFNGYFYFIIRKKVRRVFFLQTESVLYFLKILIKNGRLSKTI